MVSSAKTPSALEISPYLRPKGNLVSRGSREGVVTSSQTRRPRLLLDPVSYRRLCQQVRERDGWRCQKCGSSHDLQVHHILPRSKLGDDVAENLITLCNTCHCRVHMHACARSSR